MSGLDSDNIVLMRVETSLAAEDGTCDLVFVNLGRASRQDTAPYEQQKAPQLRCAGERRAADYSLNERPSLVFKSLRIRRLKNG
jgi:hypothetical protein